MENRRDLFFLFVFLVFFVSTFFLFIWFYDVDLLMATPLKMLELGSPSFELLDVKALLGKVRDRGQQLIHQVKDLNPLDLWLYIKEGESLLPKDIQEENGLPAVSFLGMREILLKENFSPIPPQLNPSPDKGDKKVLPREEKTTSSSPLVLILHSHTAETYWDDPYDIGTGHVSPGERGQITEVGRELASSLKAYGISVYHEERVHDMQYAFSYRESRKTIEEFLVKKPDPTLILDIHRDALGVSSFYDTTLRINGQQAARVMIIVASDELGLSHPTWRQNLQFANLLGERMEEMYPGLLRRIAVRDNRRYNQDLHPYSLLLEIGDYRNSSQEALFTARLLAQVLNSLLQDI